MEGMGSCDGGNVNSYPWLNQCMKYHNCCYTLCGYKINGLNFFQLHCKLCNSEWCVVLACALPSFHSYNFKVMWYTVWQ